MRRLLPRSHPSIVRLALSDTCDLRVRDLHVSARGVATITAAAAGTSKLGFCSVVIGVDCHSQHASCCYCLDEYVDGARFDSRRERVVVWSQSSSDSLFLHVFSLRDAWSTAFLHRFHVMCGTGQQLQRLEWAQDRLVLWIGMEDECWTMLTCSLCNATGTGGTVKNNAAPPQELDASGLGKEWERFRKVVAPGRRCNLNACQISPDASCALLPAEGGYWECLRLHANDGALPVAFKGSIAACFSDRVQEDRCELYTLGFNVCEHESQRTADSGNNLDVQWSLYTLGHADHEPTQLRAVLAPWLNAAFHEPLSSLSGAKSCARLAVFCSTDRSPEIVLQADEWAYHASAACSCRPPLDTGGSDAALTDHGLVLKHGQQLTIATLTHTSLEILPCHATAELAVPHASRTIHWTGQVASVNSHATICKADSVPASHSAFSFSMAVREHLSYGPHLLCRFLRLFASDGMAANELEIEPGLGPSWPTEHCPCALQWNSAFLETQKLLLFGWDRTSDSASWPEGQSRFFMYERYRTQNLSRRPDLMARVPPDPGLILTDAVKSLSTRLLDGYKHGQSMVIEGEASGGKTAVVAFCANRTNSPLIRFNMTPNTSISDFIGQIGLGDSAFGFHLGPFAEAVKDGLWLLLDEANLAGDGVLRVVEDVLSGGFLRLGTGGVAGQCGSANGQLTIPVHPNFRLFLTQNSADDAKYGTTRHILSATFLSHFSPVVAPAMETGHLHYIIASKLCTARLERRGKQLPDADHRVNIQQWAYSCADIFMKLYAATNDAAKAERLKHVATLRDLLQAAELIRLSLEGDRRLAVVDGLKAIFTQRLRQRRSITRIGKLIDIYQNELLPLGGGRSSDAYHMCINLNDDGPEESVAESTLTTIPEHAAAFALLDIASATRKPALICGPDISGKASAALAWARARGRECEVRVLTPDCTAEDLFGKLMPGSAAGADDRGDDMPPFQWTPGPVARAMELGRILLLRGIDAPEPAVLESLNAILEVDAEKKRSLLVGNRMICISQGFFVICTTRSSQHSLTPALASRFLAIPWGGEEDCGGKLVGQLAFHALVKSHLRGILAAVDEECAQSLCAALATRLLYSGEAGAGPRYPLAELCSVLRATRRWWDVMIMKQPEKLARGADSPTKRLEDASKSLALLLYRYTGGQQPATNHTLEPMELPVRLVDVRPGMNSNAVYDATGFTVSHRFRHAALNIVITCIKCGIPLILQGPAGVGKTKIVEAAYQILEPACEVNSAKQATRPSRIPVIQFSRGTTLQDVVGQWRPAGQSCVWVDGPLYRAMRTGTPLLCDELNLASSDVISFLVPLLDTCSFFDCPFGSGRVDIAVGFIIIAAQNPPHYAGRTELPTPFVRRAICYEVSPYSEVEALEIMRRLIPVQQDDGSQDWLTPRLEYVMHVLGYTDGAIARRAFDDITLRHVLKLLTRLRNPHTWAAIGCEASEVWKDVIRLHACILFPERVEETMKVPELAAQLRTTRLPDGVHKATFTLHGLGQSACVVLRLREDSDLGRSFEDLPQRVQVLLAKLAFCVAFREPVLLSGPSSFKSYCVAQLGCNLHLQRVKAVNTLFLSELTESADLEGSIEPHTLESFGKYLHDCVRSLEEHCQCDVGQHDHPPPLATDPRTGSTSLESIHAFLRWFCMPPTSDALSPQRRSLTRWAKTLLRELDGFANAPQGFPFCERGVMSSIRFGGFLLLEGFDLPDQAVVEGLNALLEIDRSFRSNSDLEEPINIHTDFYFFACTNASMEHDDSRRQAAVIPDNLSPAVVSRLTLIHVTPPTLDEMRTEFGCVLRRRMNHEHADAGVELMFAILLKLADLYPRMVARISLRRLLQWCDYAKLDRQLAACRAGSSDELIANLVLGGQILLLDGLGPAQRAAAVDALSAIEANYAANAAEQHACPGEVAGSVGHTSWINKTARGTWLTYLGFKLNEGVDTAITFGGFEPSASAVRNLSRLLAARDTGHPINLVGPPGVGKSAVVEAAAKLLGRPFVRISCSRSLTVDDLFGSYRPSLDEASGEMLFLYQRGALAKAIEDEGIVLLDELNLAPADVLGVLAGLLKCGPMDKFSTRTQLIRRGGTIFVAAMNEISAGGGRQELPRRLHDLLTTTHLASLENDEIRQIAHRICGASFARAEDVPKPYLLDLALELNIHLPVDVPGLDMTYNLRTLQNLTAVLDAIPWDTFDSDVAFEYQLPSRSGDVCVGRPVRPQREYYQLAALMLIYTQGCSPHLIPAAERAVARRLIASRRRHRTSEVDDESCVLKMWQKRQIHIACSDGAITFGCGDAGGGNGVLVKVPRLPKNDDVWGDASPALQRGPRRCRLLEMLHLATESKRFVMLEGPTCSGKTSAVRDLAWLRNARLLTIPVNAETEGTDLIGGFAPIGDGPGEDKLAMLNGALNLACRTGGIATLVQQLFAQLPPRGIAGDADTGDALSATIVACVEELILKAQANGCDISPAMLDKLAELVSVSRTQRGARRSKLPFRIFEGPLLVAMRQGCWLLLDNVNASSPEVMERINSLGEVDAALHLMELGQGRLIPHPSFRCFATAAKARGSSYSLSAAFRNRTIVIQCEAIDAGLSSRPMLGASDDVTARAETYDELQCLCRSCSCSPKLSRELVKLHEMSVAHAISTPKKVCGYEVTVRNLHSAALMAARGAPVEVVMRQSYDTMAPTLTQKLWEQKLFGDIFEGDSNAKRYELGDADGASACNEGMPDGSIEDESCQEASNNGTQLKEDAAGSTTREEEDVIDGKYAESDTGLEDGRVRSELGDDAAKSDDCDAADVSADSGNAEDQALESASKPNQPDEATSTTAVSEQGQGGAGAFRAAESQTPDSLQQKMQADTGTTERAETADGGELSEALLAAEQGDANILEGDCDGNDGTRRGGLVPAGNGDSIEHGQALPDENHEQPTSQPSAPLIGLHDARMAEAQLPGRGLSESLLQLAEILVQRLQQQVLTPAIDGPVFCQLQSMADELCHRAQEHQDDVSQLRAGADGELRMRRQRALQSKAAAQHVGRLAARNIGYLTPESDPVQSREQAMVDAMLEEKAGAVFAAECTARLEADLRELRDSYLRWNRRAVMEFESAIDRFETSTAAALEGVAHATSFGVPMGSGESTAVREAALEICIDRMGDHILELREKQLPSTVDERTPGSPEMEGLQLTKEDRPARGLSHQNSLAQPSSESELAEHATKLQQADAGAVLDKLNRPAQDPHGESETSTRGEDGSSAENMTELRSPDIAGDFPHGATHIAIDTQPPVETTAAFRSATIALRDRLVLLRSEKLTVCNKSASPARVVISVDVSVVGCDGAVLPTFIRLVIDALQMCNFEIEVILTGARELGTACVAKVGPDWSPHAVNDALSCILFAKSLPPLEASLGPPDALLSICPPTTELGISLPLHAANTETCKALEGTALGFACVSQDGRVDLGSWGLSGNNEHEACSKQMASDLETLLNTLQPPRVDDKSAGAEHWPDTWRGWDAILADANEAAAALNSLRDTLSSVKIEAKSMLAGERAGGSGCQPFGEDLRQAIQLSNTESDEANGWLPSTEFRSLLQGRQELSMAWALSAEHEGLWHSLESAEQVQGLSDEIIHALCTMPPNLYTQCSLGTQGKVLSIPALVKRYILGSSVTAIWKRQDRGGKRKLAICLVLDLTPSHPIDAEYSQGMVALVLALERMQFSVHVVMYTLNGVWVVQSGVGASGAGSTSDMAGRVRLLCMLAVAVSGRSSRHCASRSDRPILSDDRQCLVRQAVLLGAHLLCSTPLAATSPKVIWLLTAGVAHCSLEAMRGTCALVRSRNVEVVAVSLHGTSLAALGCPRWLAVDRPRALPAVVTAIFSEASLPPTPPTQASRTSAGTAVLMDRGAWVAKGAVQVRRMVHPVGAAIGTMVVGAMNAVPGRQPRALASHVYMSGALDYALSSPTTTAEPPQVQAPSDEDGFEDEIAAFYKKVKSSSRLVRTSVKLAWTKKGITPHDGRLMARIFSQELREETPWQLRQLSLERNSLGDVGIQALSLALAQGVLSRLTRLTLTWNGIGHEGMSAFAIALREGSLPDLEWLFLNGNRLGDKGLSALALALDGGGSKVLGKLQQLWLHENEIGNVGVAAFMAALQNEALPSLATLSLDHNCIWKDGVDAILRALEDGALPRCKNVLLSDNPAGSRAEQEVAGVLQQRLLGRS